MLGLLSVGAIAVAGVLVYNHWQERAARRAAQRAFGSGHADVLLESGPGAPAPSRVPAIQGNAMPDSHVDYVINLSLPGRVSYAAFLESWSALEHRFARRVLLAGSDGDGWRRIVPGDSGSCVALQAALQMVSRDGVVAEAELIEFRAQVETLGAGIGATPAAPEMRQALEAARELDRACADADIQVALHVVGIAPSLSPEGQQPYHVAPREDGLTLTLDVGLTPDLERSYQAMARAGAQLASAHGGRLVDDNGNTLDEHALATIGAQIDAIRLMLAERGIEPGSPLALRVFS